MSNLAKAFLGLLLVSMTFGAETGLAAKVKDYSLTFELASVYVKAPLGTTVSFGVKAENGHKFKREKNPVNVSGLTEEEIRDKVKEILEDNDWIVEDKGDNGLLVTGYKPGEIEHHVDKIDGYSSINGLTVKEDSSAHKDDAEPGAKSWVWGFYPPDADEIDPGWVVLNLNDWNIIAELDPGDTPGQAAEKLKIELENMGFVADCNGSYVILDWEDPTNSSMLGDELYVEFYLEEGAGGPHLSLEGPGSMYPIPTLTEWGMIIMFLVMAAGIVWFVMRQRRSMAKA